MAPPVVSICHGDVLDIGGSTVDIDIGKRLLQTLNAGYHPHSKPTLPDELLYDDVGLLIWNKIIFTPEFYQTHDEIALLDAHGPGIVARIEPGVSVIDIGAGSARKVEHLLLAFEAAQVPATYFALDISNASLQENMAYLVQRHPAPNSCIKCVGLWGAFEDGKDFVETIYSPRLFLSLGSVLCNDSWSEALRHLKSWAEILRQDDFLLIGMDAHAAPLHKEKIWAAYHASDGLYRQFFINGFQHANKLAGGSCFSEKDWDFDAELEEFPTTRHRFFFRARHDINLGSLGRSITKGEEFDWFDSHKYDEESVRCMCTKAGLTIIDVWKAKGSEFRTSSLLATNSTLSAE